jgi:hypothetical protein
MPGRLQAAIDRRQWVLVSSGDWVIGEASRRGCPGDARGDPAAPSGSLKRPPFRRPGAATPSSGRVSRAGRSDRVFRRSRGRMVGPAVPTWSARRTSFRPGALPSPEASARTRSGDRRYHARSAEPLSRPGRGQPPPLLRSPAQRPMLSADRHLGHRPHPKRTRRRSRSAHVRLLACPSTKSSGAGCDSI